MKDLPPLDSLSDEEKNALLTLLWQEQQRLRAEVEKLTQKRVKKTSRNSGLPPSKGFKPNQLSPKGRYGEKESLDEQEGDGT